VMTALIKPTDQMREALEKLGFATAEQAIATLGLGGLLKQLQEGTNGTGEALARLFPNVRGLSGALQIGSQANEQYERTLSAINNTASSLAQDKALEVMSTNAETVTDAVNKLKNAFTSDFGRSVLDAGANFTELAGGAESFITAGKIMVPVVIAGGAALGIMAVQSASAARGISLLALAGSKLGLLGGLTAAAVAAPSAGAALGDFIAERSVAGLKKQQEADKLLLDAAKRVSDERIALFERESGARLQSVLQSIQGASRYYLEDVANARRANDLLVDDAQRALQSVEGFRADLVSGIAKAIVDSDKQIRDSADRIRNIQTGIGDRAFDARLGGLNDPQKVFALQKRSQEQAAQALSSLSKAGTPEEISRALVEFDRAIATGEKAISVAERTGNRVLESRALKNITSIDETRIKAEQQLQKFQADRQADLRNEQKEQEGILRTIREQVAIVKENVGLFGTDGQPLSADDQAQRQKQVNEALSKLSRVDGAEKLAEQLGLTQLAQTPIQLSFTIGGGIERLQAQLQTAFDRFDLRVPGITGLEKVLGRDLDASNITQGVQDATAQLDQMTRSVQELSNSQLALEKLKGQIGGLIPEDAPRAIRAITDEVRGALSQPIITDDDLRRVQSLIQSAKDASAVPGSQLTGQLLSGTQLKQMATLLGLMVEAQEKQRAIATSPINAGGGGLEAFTSQIERLQAAIEAVDPVSKFKGAASATSAAATAATTLATQYTRAAEAAERIGRVESVGRQLGGTMLATGGSARGTDTVPAMLSPGEFVVNARSARQFHAQLLAMNAGQVPSFQTGGSVSNTTNVGDIHVHESKTPELTAQAINTILRRGQRRGTI